MAGNWYDSLFDTKNGAGAGEEKPSASPVQPEGKVGFGSGDSTFWVFTPNYYEDVSVIIDHLKNNQGVIVKLGELDPAIGQRIIDLLSGAVYALSGNITPLENASYLLVPGGVKIVTRA